MMALLITGSALAAGGGKAATKIYNVADTRAMTAGLFKWIADIYNSSLFLFGLTIVTPALNIFGFPMPYAIGTDLARMGGKSIASTIRYSKFGNVDVAQAVSMIIGTTLGMELGAKLVMYLERLGLAESVIRKTYLCFSS
ncbi:MAG: TSUP family transporter [Candidatus Zixiibacteriota bacterium]